MWWSGIVKIQYDKQKHPCIPTRKESLNYEFNSMETLGAITCKMFSARQANDYVQHCVEPRIKYFLDMII